LPPGLGNGIIYLFTKGGTGTLATYLHIVQIIVSVTLIVLILLQAKGEGLGGIFGGEGIYKTRRGVEKTLFQATVGLSIAFFIISMISVLVSE
jgi:preprotein translocase subunit SecG